jgi:hypothetical protein
VNLQKQVEGLVTLVTRAWAIEQGLAVPGVAAGAAGSLEGCFHTPCPGRLREVSPALLTTSSLSGGRKRQARVVAADSAGASLGASATSTSGARPSGDYDHLVLLGQGIVDSSAAPPPAGSPRGSSRTRAKSRRSTSRLVGDSRSAGRDWDDAPRLEFVYDVRERYELVRTVAATLRSFCSCMTRIHMLAHSCRGGMGGRGRKENVAVRTTELLPPPRAGHLGCGYWRTVGREDPSAPSTPPPRRHGQATRPPWRAHLGAANGPST